MKTFFKAIISLVLLSFIFQSCHEDQDDVAIAEKIEIQNFIWKGMNLYYLWQKDVPNLSDSKFANQASLNTFLFNYPKPEVLFNALRVNESIDRFRTRRTAARNYK
jgi:carboxyl-terminal processing protease